MNSYNYFVYILTNEAGTLYIGVTNNLQLRVEQHKSGLIKGFTQKYKIKKLIYFEYFTHIEQAILREKELKGWTRGKKLEIIKAVNPGFKEIVLEY